MPLWFAILFVKSADHCQGLGAFKLVIDALSISSRLYELFITQYSELLRQCGLAYTKQLFNLTYPQLSFGQLAKNHQTVGVGQYLHQFARLLCSALHLL